FDRESGELLYRAKLLRSLSSITHLVNFSVEWPGASPSEPNQLVHYVGFAPPKMPQITDSLAMFFLGFASIPITGMLPCGLRNDILAFRNLEDASQAATTLAAFLGVGIAEEVI